MTSCLVVHMASDYDFDDLPTHKQSKAKQNISLYDLHVIMWFFVSWFCVGKSIVESNIMLILHF